jgi:hypothetical protein
MRRRALLSIGLTAATAGCLGPPFGSDCPRGADLRLRPTSDADTAQGASDPVDGLSPPEHDAITAAIDGAESTMWQPASASGPFSGSEYFVDSGTYYAVETPVVTTVDRVGYGVTLDAGPDADTSGRAVAFDDLRESDRLALYALLGYPNGREVEKFERARSISIGGTLAFPDDETQARSELVPDPTYDVIRFGGQDFRFRITEERDAVVERRRIGIEVVAESTADFAALVYDRYGVDLDERGLSPEQRDIVETAIDAGYDECAPYSEAYVDVQRTLGRPVTRVTDDGDGVATTPDANQPERVDYANYENEWYFVRLSEYVA